MTGFRCFSKVVALLCFGRVKVSFTKCLKEMRFVGDFLLKTILFQIFSQMCISLNDFIQIVMLLMVSASMLG